MRPIISNAALPTSGRHGSMRIAQRGFTLIELIIAITLMGILAAVAAVFLRVPIDGYFDLARRTALTDIADLAVRRFARDLRTALPNSVRVTGTCNGTTPCYLEYLEVRTSGRYRVEPSGGATQCPAAGPTGYNDALVFTSSDACFRSLGDVADLGSIAAGSDYLAVYNLGVPGASAYENGAASGGNKSRILAVAADNAGKEHRFNFDAVTFPLASPDHRFYVISGPVTYICDPTTQTLTRQRGYAISATQGTPPSGGSSAPPLASGVTQCSFTYDQNVVARRNSVVSIRLQLTTTDPVDKPERVSLFSQVHVSNVP